MLDDSFEFPFQSSTLDERLKWHCEPQRWNVDPSAACLRISPDAGTDFWQRTHYGFEADNGHFLYLEAVGDFVLTTRVTSRPVHQYDQAGLMVRVSSACWIKTSVEYEPAGPNRLGAVVTNHQYSDWSTQPLAQDQTTVWFRLRLEGRDCIVESSFDGRDWTQIRMAPLLDHTPGHPIRCGLYACSPKAAGCEAEFSVLKFEKGRLR